MNAFFLALQPSAIQNKYYGETNKAVAGIFKLAKRLAAPEGSSCIIFVGMLPYPPPLLRTMLMLASGYSLLCDTCYMYGIAHIHCNPPGTLGGRALLCSRCSYKGSPHCAGVTHSLRLLQYPMLPTSTSRLPYACFAMLVWSSNLWYSSSDWCTTALMLPCCSHVAILLSLCR